MANDIGERSWRLDDAAAIAAANPYTFYKPSREAIALLRPGDLVKLIFACESNDPQAPRAVLREDASIVGLLETPAPCAFVRGEDDNQFGAVHPSEPE